MLLRDSRGRKSWTLTITVPGFVLALVKWLIGGFALELHSGFKLSTSYVPGPEAIAVMLGCLTAFSLREYQVRRTASLEETP